MKTIKGLSNTVKDARGKEVKSEEGPMNVKDPLINLTQFTKAEDGKQAVRLAMLGRKLYEAQGDELELEDADFDLLKKLVEKNELNFPVITQAAIFELFESA